MALSATVVWRVRPSGAATNGGGFDASVSGSNTDYSQQNAAQLSGSLGTAAGTSTFSDAAVTFPTDCPGNIIQIASGTGFTAGFYIIQSRTNGTTVVLDRSPGTGSVAIWKMGGGLGGSSYNPFTIGDSNLATGAKAVPGNIVYVLGSSAAPSSPDYLATGVVNTVLNGDTTNGAVRWSLDPSQPTWRPWVERSGGDLIVISSGSPGAFIIDNFIFSPGASINGRILDINDGVVVKFCTFNMKDIATDAIHCAGTSILFCEFYSKLGSTPTSHVSNFAIQCNGAPNPVIVGCNFHDLGITAITQSRGITLVGNVFDNSVATYLILSGGAQGAEQGHVANNTFNKTTLDAVQITGVGSLNGLCFINNIISNCTGSGKVGLNVNTGLTTAANDRIKAMMDFNNYFNNTTDVSSISKGANDKALDPQYTSSPGNLTLGGSNLWALSAPGAAILGNTNERDYHDLGALQHQAVGSTIIVPSINRTIVMMEDQFDGA